METTKIQTADYLDILFEGRNKQYGGYMLRKNYSSRLLSAGLLALSIVGGLFASTLIQRKRPDMPRIVSVAPTLIITPPSAVKLPPPPPATTQSSKMKSVVKVTLPVIHKDDDVLEEDKPRVVKPGENIVVGPENIKGTDNPGAIDPNVKRLGHDEIKPARTEPEQILRDVEQMPEFPGGKEALARYLSRNINYPQSAKEAHIQGKVYIQFVIDQKGHVGDIKLMKDIGGDCGEEAVRVVKGMPKWKAGKQNGQPVKVYYTLPVTFKLQ